MDKNLNTEEKDFTDEKASEWADKICTECIESLKNLNNPFKYCGMFCFFNVVITNISIIIQLYINLILFIV